MSLTDYLGFVSQRERDAVDVFDLKLDVDYLSLCEITCGGLSVREVFCDRKISEKY